MKQRLARLFLVAFALWPAVQFTLTQTHGVDPWKLFAWGMYTVPGPKPMARIVGVREDGSLEKIPVAQYSEREASLLRDFLRERASLGRFADETPLAEGMLALRPAWRGLVVVIADPELDRRTAIFTPRFEQYPHARGDTDAGEPPVFDEASLADLFAS